MLLIICSNLYATPINLATNKPWPVLSADACGFKLEQALDVV